MVELARQDAFHYCEALVHAGDRDRFVAALFAPHERRHFLYALYAFDIETAQVAARVNEPLAGEVRLQWWSDVIGGKSGAQGAPVAAALLETMSACSLAAERLTDLVDARREALYRNPSDVDDLFEQWAGRTQGNVVLLASHILAGDADAALARHAGIALACMRLVNAENGARLAALADRHLQQTRAMITAQPDTVGPAYLPLALVRPQLRRFTRAGFGEGAGLPQWRRQWILWRASRGLQRWL
jgi:phytoene synthase